MFHRLEGSTPCASSSVLLHLADGVVEAPQNWHFPYHDEEMGAAIDEAIAASDTFLMGRRMYEEWAVFWPHYDPAALRWRRR